MSFVFFVLIEHISRLGCWPGENENEGGWLCFREKDKMVHFFGILELMNIVCIQLIPYCK